MKPLEQLAAVRSGPTGGIYDQDSFIVVPTSWGTYSESYQRIGNLNEDPNRIAKIRFEGVSNELLTDEELEVLVEELIKEVNVDTDLLAFVDEKTDEKPYQELHNKIYERNKDGQYIPKFRIALCNALLGEDAKELHSKIYKEVITITDEQGKKQRIIDDFSEAEYTRLLDKML